VGGKLVGRAAAAVNAQPGRPGRLGALQCSALKLLFLVDTGAVYSVLPYSSTQPANGPAITSASGAPIACWGWKQRIVIFGGRKFKWSFLLAAVAFPLLGADFLEHFALTVNLKEYIVKARGSPPIKLVAPPAGSANALVGIRPAARSCSPTSALPLRLSLFSSTVALRHRLFRSSSRLRRWRRPSRPAMPHRRRLSRQVQMRRHQRRGLFIRQQQPSLHTQMRRHRRRELFIRKQQARLRTQMRRHRRREFVHWPMGPTRSC
jgi:hypothetical protein